MKKAARRWTEEEDQVLRKAVAKYKENESIVWHEVASNFTDRNNKDCRKRWVYTLAPSIKKGSWDDAEDALLLQGIERHGYKWALVSQVVGSRQPDQCSRRWHETLNPNITHGRWSLQEDQKLKEAVQVYGRRWTEIVERFFPDRTPIAAKNRYTQRFASRSSTGSPTGRSTTGKRPQSRAQSISGSSIDDDEDIYLQTVPDLLWRAADHSQNAQQAMAMSMGTPQHYRSSSQLSHLQTNGYPCPLPGSTLDGFMPTTQHPTHHAYSSSNASLYESSPNTTMDMFSPHALVSAAHSASGIETPMDMSPEGYFPQIADQTLMGHHSRHHSLAQPGDGMMLHADLDPTLLDHSLLDMSQFVPTPNDSQITPKPFGKHEANNFNDYTLMQQHHPDAGLSHGYMNGGNMMHQ